MFCNITTSTDQKEIAKKTGAIIIHAFNDKIDRLQDQMMDVNHKLQEHENKLQFRIRAKQSSPSVSGRVSNVNTNG